MQDLVEKISQLEQEVTALKVIQNTQNDSYTFYAYQSENMYGQTWETLSIEFIPINNKVSNTICKFYACNGQAVQYIEYVYQNPTNPLMATYDLSSDWISGLPDWTKFFYVTCYSNCEGILRITKNT